MGDIQTFGDKEFSVAIAWRIPFGETPIPVPPTVRNKDIVEGGLTINTSVSNSGMVEVGNANTKEISLTLENHDGRWDGYDYRKLYVVGSASITVGNVTTGYDIGTFNIDTCEYNEGTVTLTGLDFLTKLDVSVTNGVDFTKPGFGVTSKNAYVYDKPNGQRISATVITGQYVGGTLNLYDYTIAELSEQNGDKWGRLTSTDIISDSDTQTSVTAGDSAWIQLTPDTGWGQTYVIGGQVPLITTAGVVATSIPEIIGLTDEASDYLDQARIAVCKLPPDLTARQFIADIAAVTLNNVRVEKLTYNTIDLEWYDDDRDTDRCYTPSYVFESHFDKEDITITGIDFSINETPYTVGTNGMKLTIPESPAINAIKYMYDGEEQLSVPDYIEKYKNKVIGFSYTPFDMRVLPCPIDRSNKVMYYGTESGGVYTIDKVCAVTDWTWTYHGGTSLQGRGDVLDYDYTSSGTSSNAFPIDTAMSEYSSNPVENGVITNALNDLHTTIDDEIDALRDDFLPLSGGTMAGDITMDSNADIYLGSSGSTIEQKLADSANYGSPIRWNTETPYSETYKPQIGFYNTGNSITILPHSTDTNPWSGSVGLFLKYDTTPYLKYENQYVGRFTATPTTGRILTSDGTTGGMTSSSYSFTESTASVSLSFGGGTATITVRKKGNVVYFNASIGNTSKFASASSGDSLGTLPTGYRPSAELYMPIAMRTSGTWASATYYPCYLRIQTSGAMSIYGNTTNIRACTNIAGSVSFPV